MVPSIKMGSVLEDVRKSESSAACLSFANSVSASSISPVSGLNRHKHNFKKLELSAHTHTHSYTHTVYKSKPGCYLI